MGMFAMTPIALLSHFATLKIHSEAFIGHGGDIVKYSKTLIGNSRVIENAFKKLYRIFRNNHNSCLSNVRQVSVIFG